MRYLPPVVLFIGSMLPTTPVILSGVALGFGLLLTLAALGKNDIPFVMNLTNDYGSNGRD